MLRALTIYQPWATLIINGAKPFEFRSWPLPDKFLGQRVVIHAAQKKLDCNEAREILSRLRAGDATAARTCLEPDIAIPLLEQMIFDSARGALCMGVGLGSATFSECASPRTVASHFGYQAGVHDTNYGWKLTDIEKWDVPIYQRGYQGIWNWPPEHGTIR